VCDAAGKTPLAIARQRRHVVIAAALAQELRTVQGVRRLRETCASFRAALRAPPAGANAAAHAVAAAALDAFDASLGRKLAAAGGIDDAVLERLQHKFGQVQRRVLAATRVEPAAVAVAPARARESSPPPPARAPTPPASAAAAAEALRPPPRLPPPRAVAAEMPPQQGAGKRLRGAGTKAKKERAAQQQQQQALLLAQLAAQQPPPQAAPRNVDAGGGGKGGGADARAPSSSADADATLRGSTGALALGAPVLPHFSSSEDEEDDDDGSHLSEDEQMEGLLRLAAPSVKAAALAASSAAAASASSTGPNGGRAGGKAGATQPRARAPPAAHGADDAERERREAAEHSRWMREQQLGRAAAAAAAAAASAKRQQASAVAGRESRAEAQAQAQAQQQQREAAARAKPAANGRVAGSVWAADATSAGADGGAPPARAPAPTVPAWGQPAAPATATSGTAAASSSWSAAGTPAAASAPPAARAASGLAATRAPAAAWATPVAPQWPPPPLQPRPQSPTPPVPPQAAPPSLASRAHSMPVVQAGAAGVWASAARGCLGAGAAAPPVPPTAHPSALAARARGGRASPPESLASQPPPPPPPPTSSLAESAPALGGSGGGGGGGSPPALGASEWSQLALPFGESLGFVDYRLLLSHPLVAPQDTPTPMLLLELHPPRPLAPPQPDALARALGAVAADAGASGSLADLVWLPPAAVGLWYLAHFDSAAAATAVARALNRARSVRLRMGGENEYALSATYSVRSRPSAVTSCRQYEAVLTHSLLRARPQPMTTLVRPPLPPGPPPPPPSRQPFGQPTAAAGVPSARAPRSARAEQGAGRLALDPRAREWQPLGASAPGSAAALGANGSAQLLQGASAQPSSLGGLGGVCCIGGGSSALGLGSLSNSCGSNPSAAASLWAPAPIRCASAARAAARHAARARRCAACASPLLPRPAFPPRVPFSPPRPRVLRTSARAGRRSPKVGAVACGAAAR
jgi:hypothetical protein